MAKEHPDYRDNLELLNNRFPDYDMLSVEEVTQVLNFKDQKTVRKIFGSGFANRRISKVIVAKHMCGAKK